MHDLFPKLSLLHLPIFQLVIHVLLQTLLWLVKVRLKDDPHPQH